MTTSTHGWSDRPYRPGAVRIRCAVLFAATVLAALLTPVVPAGAAGPEFLVDSTGDGADIAADGVCAAAGGRCTLRAALMEANRAAGHAALTFAVPAPLPVTITPGSRLPTLANPAG